MSSLDARSFIVRKKTLVPADIHADEFMSALPDDKEVLVTVSRPRSPAHHRFFFALLAKVCENTKFNDPEELLDAIKLTVGHVERRMNMEGEVYARPKSISFAMMDEEAFKRFVKRATWAIQTHLGIDAEALMKEVDAEQKPRHAPAEASTVPVHIEPGASSSVAPVAAAGSEAASHAAPAAASPYELTDRDRFILNTYHRLASDTLYPERLLAGTERFKNDHKIAPGSALHARLSEIHDVHMLRVTGNGSPAECDEVAARAVK